MEKPGECEKEIKMTLKNVNEEQRDEDESDKENEDEDNERNEGECSEEEIEEEKCEDETNENGTTDSEERKQKVQGSSQRNLRNRLLLRRPSHLDDCHVSRKSCWSSK